MVSQNTSETVKLTAQRQTCVREVVVDQTQSISNAQLKLSRYRCLLETGGSITVVSPAIEDDEVEFELRFQAVSGFSGKTRTDLIEDLNAGSAGAFADATVLNCGTPGDWLDVTVQAWEVDSEFGIETGRVSLGPTSIRLDRKELCSHFGQPPYERVLPILAGDGGEYAVAVEINVG